jgi:hypothetical protein
MSINLYILENFGWRVIGKTLELCYSEVISLSLYIYIYYYLLLLSSTYSNNTPVPKIS